jgi:nucleotide-binding universal stress UspA family protein
MRILCGTDLLPKTESALERAGMLAKSRSAELRLLHVASPTESDRMLQEDMQRAKRVLQARVTSPFWRYGLSPKIEVRSGSPAHVLIDVAREVDAALIILGTHRRRLARDMLAGTIAMRLLSELKCPVLIVRRMPFGPYRDVLMALDESESSAQVVRAAEALMIHAHARASVIPVHRPSHTGVRDMLARVSNEPSRYELIAENARTTAAAVGKITDRLNPDLLILGACGRVRLRRAFLATPENRLMKVTGSDVLIVPPRDSEDTWRRRRAERNALDVVTGV